MTQPITKTVNLQDLLNQAKQETQQMMEQGIDISDPSIVTPLESIANQYSEIAFDCNQVLIQLVQKQLSSLTHQGESKIVNEF